jgi:nucleoside-diphosphate-sugar epimerase
MSTILVTGASGLIGGALAQSLAATHDVLCMSRKKPAADLPWIRGEFNSFEDLRQLDGRQIDGVAHLAAVTGGCLERDGILVNVEGTRCLMRYLMDRGCCKFVNASSIAAVGFQNVKFRPLHLPITESHGCLDRDGYGVSKYLMEEVTRYYSRQNAEIDVTNFRLATIIPNDRLPEPRRVGPLGQWAVGSITIMALTDAVRAFTLALEAPIKPGVRILNATPPRAWVADPVADILSNWWGTDADVSHFRQAGHEFDALYAVDAIRQELGFVAQVLPPGQP